MQAGDWAAYGQAQEKLDAAIKRAIELQPAQGSVTVPTPAATGTATPTPKAGETATASPAPRG